MTPLVDPSKCMIVNEPGLYRLIFKSRKPEAEGFKRWVAQEVLPKIRKTGGYIPVKPGDTDKEIPILAVDIQKELLADRERFILPAAGYGFGHRENHVTDPEKYRPGCPPRGLRSPWLACGSTVCRKAAGRIRLYLIPWF